MGVRRSTVSTLLSISHTTAISRLLYYTIEVGVVVALMDACAVLSPYLLRLVYSLLCNIGNRRKKAIRAELLPG